LREEARRLRSDPPARRPSCLSKEGEAVAWTCPASDEAGHVHRLCVLLLDEAVGKRVRETGRRFEGSLRGGVAAGLLGRGGECPVAVEFEQVVARVK